MNKQMKQHLEAVVGALVEKDTTAAKAAFHDYLRLKSQQVLMGESVESEEDDKKDDKKDHDHKDGMCEKCECDPCECDDEKDDKKKSDEDCEM